MSELVLQNQASPGAIGANLVAFFVDANGVPSFVGNDGIVHSVITGNASSGNAAQLNSVNIFTRAQTVAPSTFANTGNTTIQANNSNVWRPVGGQLTGNIGLPNPTGLSDGMLLTFIIQQGSSGNLTVTYGSMFKFSSANERTLTVTANARDVISCIYDATANLILCGARQNLSI